MERIFPFSRGVVCDAIMSQNVHVSVCASATPLPGIVARQRSSQYWMEVRSSHIRVSRIRYHGRFNWSFIYTYRRLFLVRQVFSSIQSDLIILWGNLIFQKNPFTLNAYTQIIQIRFDISTLESIKDNSFYIIAFYFSLSECIRLLVVYFTSHTYRYMGMCLL